MSAYLKEFNGQILCDEYKMELFVPMDYFENGWAQQMSGNSYELFGILRAYHYTNEAMERSTAKKTVMTFPLKFTTKPHSVAEEKVYFDNKSEKCLVLTYYKDDVVFLHNEIIQNGNDNLTFMKMIMGGKLDIVPYDTIYRLLVLNKLYNGVSYKLPAYYEEALISQYYRTTDDVTKPARFEAAVTTKNPYFARGVSQREVVANLSTFASVTYEDMTAMLTKADNNKRDGKEELISPIEANVLSLKSKDTNNS